MRKNIKVFEIVLLVLFFLYFSPKILSIPLAYYNSYEANKEYIDDYIENRLNLKETDLIGVYEFRTENKKESHFIYIDTLKNKLKGIYFGTEDSGGHGVFFYENELLNFTVDGENIGFELGERSLFTTSRAKIQKKLEKEEEKPIGISKSHLKYSGKITELGFLLKCTSKYGDCWKDEILFKKVSD